MRILILNWRDVRNPKAGGSEKYFHEISKKLVLQGYQIYWISGGWKGCKKEERVDGVNIHRVGKEISLYFLAPLAYLRLRKKIDLIIDVENGIPFFSPIFSKKKIILHIHHVHKEIWFKEFDRALKGDILAKIGYFIETKIMPTVYKKKPIITLSKSSAREIKRLGLKNIAGIVNPGIDFPKYKRVKKSKKPTVLFLNRIKRYKGLDLLLDVSKKLKDIEFIIAGEGDYLSAVKKRVTAEKMENVKIRGRVSEEEKQRLMQKSWIFVNPSLKEGWGIVNIEANFFGLPVVGTNAPGVRDSVRSGVTGFLSKEKNCEELSKKILILIKNKKLRERMGRECIKNSRGFGWENVARNYQRSVKRVI